MGPFWIIIQRESGNWPWDFQVFPSHAAAVLKATKLQRKLQIKFEVQKVELVFTEE